MVFIVSSISLETSVASVLITPLELRWSYKDRRTQMLTVVLEQLGVVLDL